jgi:Tfp pilus assembly protein PilN
MRAVNLIPPEARRGGSGASSAAQIPMYAALGLLAVAFSFVTVYVLTTNTISDRKAKLTSLQSQTAQERALALRLGSYAQFSQLAQKRVQTVRGIASTRFDWYRALSDLSRVVPANTSLQSLVATVVPGASAGGSAAGTAASSSSGAGGTSGLRSAITAPAFELAGCTSSHDDVARLMSRLRVINGVTRVTLGGAQKSESAVAGTTGSTAGSGATAGAAQGCGSNKPSFDLVVFFTPVPGAGPTGAFSGQPGTSGQPATTTTSGGGK